MLWSVLSIFELKCAYINYNDALLFFIFLTTRSKNRSSLWPCTACRAHTIRPAWLCICVYMGKVRIISRRSLQFQLHLLFKSNALLEFNIFVQRKRAYTDTHNKYQPERNADDRNERKCSSRASMQRKKLISY